MRDAMRSVAGRSREPVPSADRELGSAIRRLRRERRLTLVQVASATGLSQPFLSQLELGRSRPSMRSLFRIADALGTTQQALLGLAAVGTVAVVEGAPDEPGGEELSRRVLGGDPPGGDRRGGGAIGGDAVGGAAVGSARTDADATGRDGFVGAAADGGSGARLLQHGGGADVTEFVLTPAPFAEFYAHDRHEFLYVVRGVIELELAGDPAVVVRSRESTGYPGRTPHRFRQVGPEPAVVLVVHSADGSGAHGSGAHGSGTHGSGAHGSGADVGGADEGGADGSSADASGAHGSGAHGSSADVGGADVGGADGSSAATGGADVGGADGSCADVGGADVGGADEGGADEGGADEGGADEGGADVGGADEGKGFAVHGA